MRSPEYVSPEILVNPDTRFTSCAPGKSPCGAVHAFMFYDQERAPLETGEKIPLVAIQEMVDTLRKDTEWGVEEPAEEPTELQRAA